jgi:hypothetical protein
MTVGYEVETSNDLIFIPASDRFDGMMRFLKGASVVKRQWWSFFPNSTAATDTYSNNPRVLMPSDTPSQGETQGAGRWHQVTSRTLNTSDYSGLTSVDSNDFDDGDLAYANGQYGGLFSYRKDRNLPLLFGVVMPVGSTNNCWVRVAPAVITQSVLPSTYNSGLPPSPGLIWLFRTYGSSGQSKARSVPFLSTEDSWIPLTSPIIGSAAPPFIPDYIGQQYLDSSAKKLYISTGVAALTDWKTYGTGV